MARVRGRTSCIANFSPMQRRGPSPNGIHAHGWRALSSAESGRNRSGRKTCTHALGCSQRAGQLQTHVHTAFIKLLVEGIYDSIQKHCKLLSRCLEVLDTSHD